MKLNLEITFHTDGDFCFLAEELLNKESLIYRETVTKFLVINEPENEFIDICLVCEGDPNGCRWTARDVMEELIRGGIRTVHYWLVKRIYDLVITPKEEVLWSDDDVHYYDTMGGNYEGTHILLDIVH